MMSNDETKDGEILTLREFAIIKKQHLLLVAIDGKQRDHTRELLKCSFIVAASAHDDEGALTLLRAVLAHTNESYFDANQKPSDRHANRLHDSAANKAMEAHAKLAMELWEEMARRIGGNMGYMDMSQTKRRLLHAIACGWRYAVDEDTADECFAFLAKLQFNAKGEAERVDGALRDATNKDEPRIPKARIARALKSESAKLLADTAQSTLRIAWVKSLNPEDFVLHLNLQKNIDERVS